MNKKIVSALLVVLCPSFANAEGVGGYIRGGISSVGFEISDSAGDSLELDRGVGPSFVGGLQFANGIGVRANYVKAGHKGGTACSGGCVSFSDNVDTSETRIGVLYSPKIQQTVGFEVGLGLEALKLEDEKIDGPFLESALLLKAGQITTIDIGLGIFDLEADDGTGFEGAEFRLGALAKFSAGGEIGARVRRVHLENDDFGITTELDFTEIGITLGASF